MKKTDMKLIFDNYNGLCAYCGTPLLKGWHVDELEPCVRQYKTILAHYILKETGETVNVRHLSENEVKEKCKWIPSKTVQDGYLYPERLNLDNQMPSCASCNINKHSGSLEEFRSLIKGFMKHLNEINTQYKIAKRYGLVTENDIEVKFYFETLKKN